MSLLRSSLLACLTAASATLPVQAGNFTLTGDLQFHNEVLHFDFTLAAAGTDVRIWTDSWSGGVNFDPTAAVWMRSGPGHTLLAEVDDDDTVAAGQGFYDTGFALGNLAAGHYRLTLGAAVNAALGTQLSDGFLYDGEAPIAIGLWNQPSYNPDLDDQKGSFWRLNFSGVDQVSAVPEPGTALLLAIGGGWLFMARRRAT